MWHAAPEYLLLAGSLGLILHWASRRYLACTIGGAAACSILSMLYGAWQAGWQVNPGWALPMFIVGTILALPACAIAGLPALAIRRW